MYNKEWEIMKQEGALEKGVHQGPTRVIYSLYTLRSESKHLESYTANIAQTETAVLMKQFTCQPEAELKQAEK